MRIQTTRFGPVEVDGSRVLHFSRGLVGFSRHRRYVLLPHADRSPFWILQSVDDPDLAFVVMDPRDIEPSYVAAVPADELTGIGISTPEEAQGAVVLVIIRIPRDPREATANLRAPLVINPANGMGVQVILEKSPYGIRHPIFPAARAAPEHNEAAPAGRLTVTRS